MKLIGLLRVPLFSAWLVYTHVGIYRQSARLQNQKKKDYLHRRKNYRIQDYHTPKIYKK